MLKSQRAAYVALMLALDVAALLLAFVAAWALRDSLGNSLVWMGDALNYPVKSWVRYPPRISSASRDLRPGGTGSQGNSTWEGKYTVQGDTVTLYGHQTQRTVKGKLSGNTITFYSQSEARSPVEILLSPNPLIGFKSHLLLFYLAVPAWLFFLHTQGGYDPQSRRNARQQSALCAYAGLLGTALFLILLYLIKFQVSRLLILNFMLLGIGFLCIDRTVLLPLLQRRGRQPIRNLLVIGNQTAVQYFSEVLQTPAYRWSRLIGFVSDVPPPDNAAEPVEVQTPVMAQASAKNGKLSGTSTQVSSAGSQQPQQPLPPYLGKLSDLETVLDRHVIDEVVMVRSHGEGGGAPGVWGDILELCLQRGRTVSLVDDIAPPVGAKVEAAMTGNLPTLVLHNTPQNTFGLALKNVMDRAVALIALIVLAPLLLAIAIAIKITSPGPVLFKQKRVGLNGRLFSFYKFRSMVINAEEILEKNRAEWEKHNKMSGGFFKWEDDPRITKVGKILRKYSLDELPQFWNVLRGDMSLVGPRPPLPKEVEQLQPWQRRKLSVKGGLTCLWQVSGRNEINTDEWMRLDLEYIDNWSLWLDIKLLLKTVKVLVKPKGAS